MNKNQIKNIVIIVILVILVSGCTENSKKEEEYFVGEWNTNSDFVINFESDGTCIFNNMPGTWELTNNSVYINITYPDGKNMMLFTYEFSDDYNKLELTDMLERKIICEKK